MKFAVVFAINLVVLVQISQSHTVPPKIIEKFEPDEIVLLKEDSKNPTEENELPEVITEAPESSKPKEPPTTDTKDKKPDSPNKDELVFAQIVSEKTKQYTFERIFGASA